MRQTSIVLFIITLIFGCVILGILSYVPEHEVTAGFRDLYRTFTVTGKTVMVVAGVSLVLVLVIGVVALWKIAGYTVIAFRAAARLRDAQALQAEREASLVITVAQPGSQIYASEVTGGNLNLIHKPLHLAAGFVNGSQVEPTIPQAHRWSFYQLTQNISKKPELATQEMLQIEAPLPDHVNLSDYVNGSTSLRSIFLGVGRFPDGQVRPVSAPLGRLVHIAVAGSSGFGKSTLMQSLCYQALNAREEPSVVLLDTQAVAFTVFDGDPHLRYPLASDPNDIRAVLAELVAEMVRRKDLFARWRAVETLDKYNSVVSESERLPAVTTFFDEFGLVAGDKKIADYVDKLAAGGRKFGMYFICGAQTWYSDRIASSLKANLSTSVQFYARSKGQSRVLLGESNAVDLTRPGQALCRLPGQHSLIEMMAPDAAGLIDVTPSLIEARAAMPEPEPDEQESRILALHAAGESYNEIARQVFGSTGGKQTELIKQVISKFS